MNVAKRAYDLVGLRPYPTALLHLILVGIPMRFGLLPTGFGYGFIPENILQDPCTMFNRRECSEQELFALKDFGVGYICCYQLAWFVWFFMRKTKGNLIAFHKLLLGASGAMLVTLAVLHMFFRPASSVSEFNPAFFYHMVVYNSIAVVLSAWTILTHPAPWVDSMKWSIPANSIFSGAVINIFMATAKFQSLMNHYGIERYYRQTVTPTVKLCFFLGAFVTLIHSILLFRVRSFLNVPQLRSVCLYKLLVNVALPFIWLPELNDTIVNNGVRLPLILRGILVLTYLFGFLWAGKAEGVSRMLSSEKDR